MSRPGRSHAPRTRRGFPRPGFVALLAAWAATPVGAQQEDAQGRALFLQEATPPCALCHSLRAAGAAGAVGPDLDALRPDAGRVAQALRQGIGLMPSYGESLNEAQIEALAGYVSRAAGVPER